MTKCNIECAEKKEKEIIIPMSEMKPLEIGEIVEEPYCQDAVGSIIMRIGSEDEFEVIIISDLKEGSYQDPDEDIKVKLLDATLTVTIHGNLEERE